MYSFVSQSSYLHYCIIKTPKYLIGSLTCFINKTFLINFIIIISITSYFVELNKYTIMEDIYINITNLTMDILFI